MVESCAAISCTSRRTKGVQLKFHRIPKDQHLRQLWLRALRRVNFNPSKTTVICEKHFTPEDYFTNAYGNKTLKKDAIPSKFDFPAHLIKEIKKRRPLKRKFSDDVSETVVGEPQNKNISQISGQSTEHSELTATLMAEPGPSTEPQPKYISQISGQNTEHSELTATLMAEPDPSTSKKQNPDTTETLQKTVQRAEMSPRREPVFFGDFIYSDLNYVERRKRFWKVAGETVSRYKKLNKYYQCKVRRQAQKIQSLNSLLDELMKKQKISSTQTLLLKECIPETQKQLLFRQLKGGGKIKYSPELRSFALTLNFYSAAAYNYVRKLYGTHSLPHPRTLAKWYSTIDGTPGYSAEALRAIKTKVETEKKKGKSLVGGLMMDEMFIHEHVHWTGSRHVGYVNFGTVMQSDILPKAKKALVFMIVGLNTLWKVPIAYFLVDSLTAEEKCNLVKGCLLQLANTGIVIKSLTFDGDASNIAMANLLGANMSYPNTRPYFVDPNNNEKIHILLDACHMLKLVRNTLGDQGFLRDGEGNQIKWQYFKELVKLQEESGLHCATKLRSRHIQYFKEKMRVKLAVQTFSTSVADALEYCSKDLNISAFAGSEGTAIFCRNINNIFDFLNIRNFLGNTEYKKPLYKNSENFLNSFVSSSVEYLSSLKNFKNEDILTTGRKTGFFGLILCLLSVQNLYNDLVKTEKLKFLLTYKLSQDHLEMFFSAIRRRGGFCNNPTALQFEQAYKRLLIHSEITSPDSANCLALDETSILNVSSKVSSSNSLDTLNEVVDEAFYAEEGYISSYSNIQNCMYICDVVEYIAGFIARNLIKTLNCNECSASLIDTESKCKLLLRKNRGGLCKASKDIIKICLVAENVIKTETNFSSANIMLKLICRGMRHLNINYLFLSLAKHSFDQDPLHGHVIQLIRLILKKYFTVRLHHINSTKNEVQNRLRQKLTKTIHFYNQ